MKGLGILQNSITKHLLSAAKEAVLSSEEVGMAVCPASAALGAIGTRITCSSLPAAGVIVRRYPAH